MAYTHRPWRTAEDAYNATLMAATPDLLKACKAAYTKICGDGLDGNYGEHEDNPLPTMLREAIAKAEGK